MNLPNNRRSAYYKVHIAGLILSLCIVLIFPLIYVTARERVAETYTRDSLDKQPDLNRYIMLWNDALVDVSRQELIQQQLGEILVKIRTLSLTNSIHCGLYYLEGATINPRSPFSQNCYTFFTYLERDFNQYFKLVEGRVPAHIQRPDQPDNQMDAPDGEAVITQTVAEIANYTVGDRIIYNDEIAQARILEIVGIIQVLDPDLPFWRVQPIMVKGVNTPVGDNLRYDFGLMVPPQTFAETIADIAPAGSMHIWEIETDLAMIQHENLATTRDALRTMEQQLIQNYPDMAITNHLNQELSDIATDIDTALASIFWLTLSLWLLLLAQLFYLTVVTLKHQSAEWHILLKEGTPPLQLALLHLNTIAGPGLGISTVILMPAVVVSSLSFSILVFIGSGICAVLIILLAQQVTFWQWETQLSARLLFRYGIDGLLVLSGTAFVIRLLLITDMGQRVEPATFSNLLNLAGTLLLILGGSLLIVRLMAAGIKRVPIMAGWLVVITLIIGVIGWGANRQHTRSTRQQALQEVGADIRIQFDKFVPNQDWAALPNVRAYESLLWLEDNGRKIVLLGVENDSQYADLLAQPPLNRSGLQLPNDTTRLTLQLYSQPLEQREIDVTLGVFLRNSASIPFSTTLETLDASAAGLFSLYWVDIPSSAHAPWYLETLTLLSRPNDAIRVEHNVYIDDIHAELRTGESVFLEGFESVDLDAWRFNNRGYDYSAFRSLAHAAEGNASLRFAYELYPYTRSSVPTLPINPVESAPVPALVSSNLVGVLSTSREKLQIGNRGSLELALPLGNVQLELELVDVQDQIAGLDDRAKFIVVPYEHMLSMVNARASLKQFYHANTILLHLEDPTPTPTLREELVAYDAQYAWDVQQELNQRPLQRVGIDMLLIGFGMMCFGNVLIVLGMPNLWRRNAHSKTI